MAVTRLVIFAILFLIDILYPGTSMQLVGNFCVPGKSDDRINDDKAGCWSKFVKKAVKKFY